MLNVTCRDLDDSIKDILEPIVHDFQTLYPKVEGEAYLGYPIYFNKVTNEKTSVDMALITKIGIFIFNVLTVAVPNYGEIQDDIYLKIKEKFERLPSLRNGKKLKFVFHSITYSTEHIAPVEESPIVFSADEVKNYIRENKEKIQFSDFDYTSILSAIQEAYGLNVRKERKGATLGTKAYKINEANDLIEKYDHYQMDAILGDMTGIQRIRGMAGSGKTVVLARKAVETFMAHRDWIIVITYSTRALKNQLVRYVSKFYADKNEGEKYDPNKIRIMQAWGSASSVGVYYDVCKHHKVNPLNFTEAKTKYGKNRAFSKACEELMREVPQMDKMYDCILIDEAQDFDKNFLYLCLNVLGDDKRLVYAYDELQQLNEETMPTPKEIFGKEIQNDTPLTVCYRNQSSVIVTCHWYGYV
jgi:superfamily I DNA and RNA helicase